MFPLRPTVALLLCGFLWANSLLAQEPAAPAAPILPEQTGPRGDEGGVQALEPDTFLLPDKEGNLQTVLRFPFEDFIEAIKLRNQIDGPEKQPRYSLQHLDVTGNAGGDHAQLRIELTILTRTSGWVRVPLGLSQIVLREPAKHVGTGEHFLHFDQQQEGYVSWIRSEPGETHQLVLETLVPLVKLGSETALQLGAPRATTSQFQIDVSLPKALGRLVDSTQPLTTEYTSNVTRFAGMGLGGEFELAWRSSERPMAKVPTALESYGVILARLDGRSVRSEARLTVRSFGGEFEQFRVRLPPGAELITGSQPGYTLAPVDASPGSTGRSNERLVDVKLDRKTVGPVEVRLVTEQSRELAGADPSVELAGFEVLNAIRQWGHLAVEVTGDWQVVWGTKHNIRQVEELPDTLRRNDLVAGFEYFSQPCSLPARVIPRTTRVRVEPEFVVSVGAQQATLEARLKYSVRGAKVFSFDVLMPGWELDTVTPNNIVDSDSIVIGDLGVVSIPLLQPATGQIELVLKARRDLGENPAEIALPLPIADATSQTPSTVIVQPEDNVQLAPLAEKLVGLAPMQVAPRIKLPVRQQMPLFYRGESDPATFAATMEVHPQAVSSAVTSTVYLEQHTGQVDQTFSYQVAYEPVDKLTLAVPRSLAVEELQVMFEGQALVPAAVSSEAAGGATSPEVVPVRVSLPQPRIGNFELLVSYPLANSEIQPQQSVALLVPLVMPLDGRLEKNAALVQPALGMRVSHRPGTWDESEIQQAVAAQRELHLAAAVRTGELPLAVQLEEQLSPGSTVIYRAWLQTWLTSTDRQDRAVFRFSSNEEQLKLTLPEGIDPAGIEVVLDEALVPVELSRENTLAIPLSATNNRRRQLELRYNFHGRQDVLGSVALAAPQMEGGMLLENVYWQLILPRNEHLIRLPENMIPEFQWGWHDFYWGRHPLRSQSQLELWSGAAAGAQPPPTTNQYLFSSLQVPQGLELQTASRATIVLLCSGVVLIAGLIFLYVPALRQPGVIFAGAVVLLALGLIYPEPMLLAAQAAVLGLIMVLIAGLLKRLATRRHYEIVVPGSSSLMMPSRATTESPVLLGSPPTNPSSATTTIALHTPEPNA